VSRYLRRDNDNPNTFIGIILLIVLGVFVGPNLLPEFLSDLSPYIFAGIPCSRLPSAENLTAHQSVIGRAVQDPLVLEVDSSNIGDDNSVVLRLTITNSSLGTVPIVYVANDIATTDDGSVGFGIIINPAPVNGVVGRQTGALNSYPETSIKMLGPRQKCVHSFQLTASGPMTTNGGTAQAYYRINTSGQNQPPSIGTQNIYPDQGLDILTTGVIFSDVATIPRRELVQG